MNIIANGKELEKSYANINLIAMEADGKWQLVHLSSFKTVREKKAGKCFTYLFEKKNMLVAQVYFPAGLNYQKVYHDFYVTMENEVKIIKSDGWRFVWNTNGELVNGDNKSMLGNAKSNQEAVSFTLQEIYKDRCTGFVIR